MSSGKEKEEPGAIDCRVAPVFLTFRFIQDTCYKSISYRDNI
jgi:hypothetical protein